MLYYIYKKIKKKNPDFAFASAIWKKFKKSLILTFIPFILKLELEAVFALFVMAAKNIIDLYHEFEKNNTIPGDFGVDPQELENKQTTEGNLKSDSNKD